MKKILCFFSALCMAVGILALCMPTQRVFCDENVVELKQSNFVTELQNPQNASKSFVLTEDIFLSIIDTI